MLWDRGDENNNMSPPLYKAEEFNSLVFDQNGRVRRYIRRLIGILKSR